VGAAFQRWLFLTRRSRHYFFARRYRGFAVSELESLFSVELLAAKFAIGAPGATQIAMGVLQVTLNVLDFAMSMLEAVSMPRFSATSDVIDLSNRIPRSVERELNILGYQTVRSPLSHTFAWVHGIKITAQGMEGGADPTTDGMALSAL
jgi:gamma-glutamyltranspeptidase